MPKAVKTNRRVFVLKMLVFAIDELVRKGKPLHKSALITLTLQYGKSINIEAYELVPFFDTVLLDAIKEE